MIYREGPKKGLHSGVMRLYSIPNHDFWTEKKNAKKGLQHSLHFEEAKRLIIIVALVIRGRGAINSRGPERDLRSHKTDLRS